MHPPQLFVTSTRCFSVSPQETYGADPGFTHRLVIFSDYLVFKWSVMAKNKQTEMRKTYL